MASCPPVYVDVPLVQPYRHGLFGAVVTPESPDHVECGVEFEPLSCRKASTTHDPCNFDGTAPGTVPDKITVPGVDLESGTPFTVYADFTCTLVGRTLEDVQRRAEAALALGEARAVEFAYWTGIEGNRPRLADPSAVQVAGGTDGVSPTAAIAALEDYLGREYGGIGTLHAPRGMAAYWHDHLHAENGVWTSRLGTKLALGGGYSAANTGPDGAVAPAGKAWVYATGQTYLWRSDVWFNPTPIEQALDKRTNTVSLLAERTYVLAHECVLAAALVDLACCPC